MNSILATLMSLALALLAMLAFLSPWTMKVRRMMRILAAISLVATLALGVLAVIPSAGNLFGVPSDKALDGWWSVSLALFAFLSIVPWMARRFWDRESDSLSPIPSPSAGESLHRKPIAIERSELSNKPVLTSVQAGLWRLEMDYQAELQGRTITVPATFEFDLASVPRLFWPVIAPFELSVAAPLLHDFLYRYKGSPPADSIVPVGALGRKAVDRLFLELMTREGISPLRAFAAYAAVRLFGSFAWGRKGGQSSPEEATLRKVLFGVATIALWLAPLILALRILDAGAGEQVEPVASEPLRVRVDSIEPAELVPGIGRYYTVRGLGFSEASEVCLDIPAFVGSSDNGDSNHRPQAGETSESELKVFIRPFGGATTATANLVVGDNGVFARKSIPVRSPATRIANLTEQMSIEELIGQTLIVGFDALDDDVSVSNEGLARLVRELKIGGVMVFKHNIPRPTDSPGDVLNMPRQVARLTNSLQEAAFDSQSEGTRIPLLIAIDQEGGSSNILRGPGFTQMPENAFLGVSRDADLARKVGLAVGRELRYLGINTNLAPVADIVVTTFEEIENLNHVPTIGLRSFGGHEEIVMPMAISFMQGLQSGGVLSIGKHFPGHGDTLLNPHHVLPVLEHAGRMALENRIMAPFQKLIRSGVNGIMTSHILVKQWDAEHSVTFSGRVVEEKLRKKLGFEGLVITDDMSAMESVLRGTTSKKYPLGKVMFTRLEAVLRAHKAGHDLTILGYVYPDEKLKNGSWAEIVRRDPITRTDLKKIIDTLVQLYAGMDGGEELLRQRVARVLEQKAMVYGIENFEELDRWRTAFNSDEYESLLSEHSNVRDLMLSEGVVLLVEDGVVRYEESDFKYFSAYEGPLSIGRGLVELGDDIALASPVFKRPDELWSQLDERAHWIGDIDTVRLVYGYHNQEAIARAMEEWDDDTIQNLVLRDELGNLVFGPEDVREDIASNVEARRSAAEKVASGLESKVTAIVNAATGKKVLVFGATSCVHVELLERVVDRLDQMPGTRILVLLFREPYLISNSTYENPKVSVISMTAFPDPAKAVDVLLGKLMPKPSPYASLSFDRMKVSTENEIGVSTGARPCGGAFELGSEEATEDQSGELNGGQARPSLGEDTMSGLVGSVFYLVVWLLSRFASTGGLKGWRWLWSGSIALLVGAVIGLALHFGLPFVSEIRGLDVPRLLAETSRGRPVVIGAISFVLNLILGVQLGKLHS